MDKKEVYEHLAKIYLDASTQKKKKIKKHPLLRLAGVLGIAAVFGVGSAMLIRLVSERNSLGSQVALVMQPDAAKINFHFEPARKEIYSLSLNRLNMTRYSELAFSLKKGNFSDTITLKVEFTNAFREKAAIFLRDIPSRWREYKLNFSEFKSISDWSEMSELSFIVEEWNTKSKQGVVYIDNVYLLR